MKGRGTVSMPPSVRSSPTMRPYTTLGVVKELPASPILVLPNITSPATKHHRSPWPTLFKRALAESNPFIAYSVPNSGAVDHWKKIAKKAEWELILERDTHQANNTKNHLSIHRLSRRLIPLEKALGRRNETVKYQSKMIEDLKLQLISLVERRDEELSHLRSQNRDMQRNLAVTAEKSSQKISELKEELHQANSRMEVLQQQMNEIYINVGEFPDSLNLPSTGDSEAHRVKETERCTHPPSRKEKGLAVMAKIYKMRVNNDQFKNALKEKNEKLSLMAEDNELQKRLAQEAANRNKKLMELVQSLKTDREIAMSQLKEAEDVIASMETLENFVHSCLSPRDTQTLMLTQRPTSHSDQEKNLQQNSIRAISHRKQEVTKHSITKEARVMSSNFGAVVEATTDLSAMRTGPGAKVVCFKDMGREGAWSNEVNLIKKLHEAFQLIASKAQGANQVSSKLKEEREEIHLAVQEACEELLDETSMPSDVPDLTLVMAIRKLKCAFENLKQDKAVQEALIISHKEQLLELQSQNHNLFQERIALLQSMDAERNELTSIGELMKREKASTEKELNDLRRLYTESQGLIATLQKEKGMLAHELIKLKENQEVLNIEKMSQEALLLESEREKSEIQHLAHELAADKTYILEILEALKKMLQAEFSRGKPVTQSLVELCTRPICGVDISDLLDMTQRLVNEKYEAQSIGAKIQEQLRRREKELSDLHHLLMQSKLSFDQLQNDTDTLQIQLKSLHSFFTSIESLVAQGESTSDSETLEDKRDLQNSDRHRHETLASAVLAMKQKLVDAENIILQFEEKTHEMEDVLGIRDQSTTDLPSEADRVLIVLKVLKENNDQLIVALRDCRELHGVVKKHLKQIQEGLEISDSNLGCGSAHEQKISSIRDEPTTIQEVMKAPSDFANVFIFLPDLVKKVRSLKIENNELNAKLNTFELENQTLLRKHGEDSDKLLKSFDRSLQEVQELRQQMNAIQLVMKSVATDTSFHKVEMSDCSQCEATTSGEDTETFPLLKEFDDLKNELLDLRSEKSMSGVKISELLSTVASEQAKIHDLEDKLSLANIELQKLSERALLAETSMQTLMSQDLAAKNHVLELFNVIVSEENKLAQDMQDKNYGMTPTCRNIVEDIKALQNKVIQLQLVREKEMLEIGTNTSKWKEELEALQKDVTTSKVEIEILEKKLRTQEETYKLESLSLMEKHRSEFLKLGGFDVTDEGEKMRRNIASERVKEIISQGTLMISRARSPQKSIDSSTQVSPLSKLATFKVELLVNSKVFSHLEMGGHAGGLNQAALHYFHVDAETGDITFENALVPGSQSCNLVVDLSLIPTDRKVYQTQTGDVLGLCIKVSTFDDKTPREVLYNTNIVRTNEVLEAIEGQAVKTFSLWPDLVSSWRWERKNKDRWNLKSIRWRFLLKNIFPELSDPLQALAIIQAASGRSRASTSDGV